MENEKRLVDAEAIARKLKNAHCAECHVVRKVQCSACWVEDVLELLEDEVADAVEVVHGHWEDGWGKDCYGNIVYKSIDCSHCNEIFKVDRRTRKYWKERFKVCPFCGAKMDGGNEDGSA